MFSKALKKSMPSMLNFIGAMKMSAEVKWNGLIHEKLFCETPSEYTTKIDPIEPKSILQQLTYLNFSYGQN